MRALFALILCLAPLQLAAQGVVADIVEHHVLPRYATLAEATERLADVTEEVCDTSDSDLMAAYSSAFDAWVAVSHLRFGPSEEDDRAFALAFWPDTRGFTPKILRGFILDEEPAGRDPEAFREVSIAARGFYPMEFLLFDPEFEALGSADYRCALLHTMAVDAARNARAIHDGWTDAGGYAQKVEAAGTAESPYATPEEALQEFYKALATGLQFTSDTRIGRPLGTFDKPRPERAEARRSERSLHHVELSLLSLRDLAERLAADHDTVRTSLDAAFATALAEVEALRDDPVLAGVSDPTGRLEVEILQQSVDRIREVTALELGPTLGVAAGFNALDGD